MLFLILARLSSAIYKSLDFACLSLDVISHPCGSRTSQVTPLGVILDPQGNPAERVKVQASFSTCKNMKGVENMSVTILPTFKGYTVDLKLMEFRKSIPEAKLEFIPFLSPKGLKLWHELEDFAEEIIEFYDYK